MLLAELRTGRYFKERGWKYEVATVGLTKDPITTLGGLKILPDLTVSELKAKESALLILPGGETWLQPLHAPIYEKVGEFIAQNIPVAAICGATVGLAAHGFLNTCRHTSNDLGYLKACCPAYKGEKLYVREPAVCDGNLITATGVAPLEFAREVMKKLDVLSPAALEAWYQLFRTHETAHYYKLMESLPKK